MLNAWLHSFLMTKSKGYIFPHFCVTVMSQRKKLQEQIKKGENVQG